jgi:hypothetical protein
MRGSDTSMTRVALLASRAALIALAWYKTPAHAQQVVVLDTTYTATADKVNDSHFPATPAAASPANWRAPTDYIGDKNDGSVYVQLDILEKPSDEVTLYNICFENSANYACMPYAPKYTKTGRDDFSASFGSFYQNDMMDWTKGVSKIQLILKDSGEKKPQNDDTATFDKFYPTKVHVVLTLVAPGAKYTPPSSGAAGSDAAAGSGGGNDSAAPSGGSGGSKPAADSGGSGGKPASMTDAAGRSGSATGSAGSSSGASSTTARAGSPAAATAGRSGSGSLTATITQAAGTSGASAAANGVTAGRAGTAAVKPVSTEDGGGRSVSAQLEDSGGCSTTRASHTEIAPVLLALAAGLRRRRRSKS